MNTREEAVSYLPTLIQKLFHDPRYQKSFSIGLIKGRHGWYLTTKDLKKFSPSSLYCIYRISYDMSTHSRRVIKYDVDDYDEMMEDLHDDIYPIDVS